MFSLIIAIISIALVAALALATIYYGGDAFNKGSSAAKASQLINEGQQLAGAITLNETDGAADSSKLKATVADLAPEYLTQVPEGWDGTVALTTNLLQTTATVTDKVCDAVNEKAGVAVEDKAADVAGIDATKVYGCFGAGANANTVFYRF
ncbi:hypothetical protein D3C71_23050 [compost metagenome]